jgi:hypothetical protein
MATTTMTSTAATQTFRKMSSTTGPQNLQTSFTPCLRRCLTLVVLREPTPTRQCLRCINVTNLLRPLHPLGPGERTVTVLTVLSAAIPSARPQTKMQTCRTPASHLDPTISIPTRISRPSAKPPLQRCDEPGIGPVSQPASRCYRSIRVLLQRKFQPKHRQCHPLPPDHRPILPLPHQDALISKITSPGLPSTLCTLLVMPIHHEVARDIRTARGPAGVPLLLAPILITSSG